ncbi:peptidase M48 [Mangrovactinospora gilvigrisea]|uniref:Peptidase M48 n=1 Tax=Mangrovactinospora gilvigrisea TaxID=1428644 RepID=A0A1J7BGH3_9ACTN|nr:M48 family metallopeptidase [Mangrovactinospora gilvigrisea]OIV37750.1 peptidase M48 [Mangrovactinospora gilvigrisea]
MTDANNSPSRNRTRFPGISSRAYEHPADRSALTALRSMAGFDIVLKKMAGLFSERSIRLLFLATAVRASEQQFTDIHNMVRDAAYILDLEEVPTLYVQQDPIPNAFCIGMDKPIIVVTTGLVDLMDEEELRSVIGHEVGHAMSGHAVYRTMLLILTRLATALAWLPLGTIAIRALILALLEWFRKSELSCDRAGLLVGQDLQASQRALMKLAGGAHLAEMNIDAFLKQAEEYRNTSDVRDSVLKVLAVLPQSHPFTAVRCAELKEWVESGDYERILEGEYPRREDDRSSSIREEFKKGADHYADKAKSSSDPLLGILKDVAGGAGDVGSRLRNVFTGSRSGGGDGGNRDEDNRGNNGDSWSRSTDDQ